ncbi:hypothetical protein, partial [Klebsiella pasteurii]|uniref:hypothetical protein n=1 Tax=Klebsiella pasteurii TaxID=2587529 RepID=UPI00292DDC19
AHDMPPGSLNGPVKLTIARTSELSHRRTLLLSHYNLGAHNKDYVKLQAKTSKPLVMRVNLRKPLLSVP